MAIQVIELVFAYNKVTPTQKLVLLALANFSNIKGQNIYPSVGTIAAITSLQPRSVRRTIKELINLKLIKVTKNADNKRQKTNIYAIDIKRLSKGKGDIPSPLTESHPDTESGEGGHTVTQTVNKPDNNISIIILESWNNIRGDTNGRVKFWNDKRKRAFKKCYGEFFNNNYDEWVSYLHYIGTCPWLIGGNSSNWKANFDWCIEPKNITKILEGNYEQRNNSASGNASDTNFNGFNQAVNRFKNKV